MPSLARATIPDTEEVREPKRYRFTFLRRGEDRAVAAFELFLRSEDQAAELASELLHRSQAELAEVWSEGRAIVRLVKPAATH
jgi:hypothetical protein